MHAMDVRPLGYRDVRVIVTKFRTSEFDLIIVCFRVSWWFDIRNRNYWANGLLLGALDIK